MGSLLDVRPNKVGIGVIFGIVLVTVSLIMIGLDMAKVTRQVQPPPFLADFVPEAQEVCVGLSLGSVEQSNELFHSLDWPEWPEARRVECAPVHLPAGPGTVRWHSCQSLRSTQGNVSPPCPSGKVRGATYAQTNSKGEVVAADIYLWPSAPNSCRWSHEEAHARGFLVDPDEDAETKYVQGAHTEKPGHLLGEQCGYGLKWLDRSPLGDWPYRSEVP